MEVSIIIPVYNKCDYLEECIDSILAQSFTDFEVLLVDDGSTDGSSEMCDKLAGRDSRITVFHKQNGGATSARKFGVENATGKWIMFVDADDMMPSGAMNDLIQHDDGESDIIAGTILYKTRDRLITTQTEHPFVDKEQYICLLLSRKTYYGPCSKLIKRSLFEGLKWNEDPRLFQNEDLLMLVFLSVKCSQHIYVSNEIIHYICEDKEGSMSTRLMSYDGWKLLFSDLREAIFMYSDTDSRLFTCYVNYAIWNIYDCLLTQAINIPQDEFIRNLIEDSKKATIAKKNLKVLPLLLRPLRRKIFCKYRRIRIGAKRIFI